MIETDIPNLSNEEILKQIQKEIEKNKNKKRSKINIKKIETMDKLDNTIEDIQEYDFNYFYGFGDKEFVEVLYRVLLQRDVDSVGLETYLSFLRSGKRDKMEIICAIRNSSEGKSKNIKLKGFYPRLIMSYFYKIPIVGISLKWLTALITLPKKFTNIYSYEKNNNIKLEKLIKEKTLLENRLNSAYAFIDDILDNKPNRDELNHLQKNLNDKLDLTKEELNLTKEELDLTKEELNLTKEELDLTKETLTLTKETLTLTKEELQKNIDKKAYLKDFEFYFQSISYVKEYIKLSSGNLQALIDKAEKRLPKEFTQKEIKALASNKEKTYFDMLYIDFENKFRGEEELIQERLRVYLPYINSLPFDKKEMEILDVGCGRGEWLKLLLNEGYSPKGLDINSIMVQKSKEKGLNVIESDVIEYLTSLPDNSLNAISGFHIVEHLPFEVLIKFFQESFRVLKKGGIAIFETPNPDNIVIGSCSFYTDPTHRNPIPSGTLKYLLEYQGFSVETLYLHPLDEVKLDGVVSSLYPIVHRFNTAQDYSVIGVKI